jgi:hypothetical protein
MSKPTYDSLAIMQESKPKKHKAKTNKICKRNLHKTKKIVTTTKCAMQYQITFGDFRSYKLK